MSLPGACIFAVRVTMLTFDSSRWGSDFVNALTQSGETGAAGKHVRCDSGVALEDLLVNCTL